MSDSDSTLQQQAISAALSSDWKTALKINQEIISSNPNSVEALNRLGRAYFELGNLTDSKKFFEEALQNDPYNQIATKFIQRIKTFSKKGSKLKKNNHLPIDYSQISSDLFIEEPGKTKVIGILKVAEPQKLSLLSAGVPVKLVIKNHNITVVDFNDSYLGVLPDDVSHLLIRLIKGGNKYQAFIKNIKTNSLSILVREIFRSSRFRNQPSFLDGQSSGLIYSSDNLVVAETLDDDEPFTDEDNEDNLT